MVKRRKQPLKEEARDKAAIVKAARKLVDEGDYQQANDLLLTIPARDGMAIIRAARGVLQEAKDIIDRAKERLPIAGHDETFPRGLPSQPNKDGWRSIEVRSATHIQLLRERYGCESPREANHLDGLSRSENTDLLARWAVIEGIAQQIGGKSASGKDLAPVSLTGPRKDIEPLSPTEQEVYDVIVDRGPVTGVQIENAIGTPQSTIRTHIIPALKEKRGIKNAGNHSGYYLPDGLTPPDSR